MMLLVWSPVEYLNNSTKSHVALKRRSCGIEIVYQMQSHLYIKATQGNLKMWPLWAVALYYTG
jgi:hypothetical protein